MILYDTMLKLITTFIKNYEFRKIYFNQIKHLYTYEIL